MSRNISYELSLNILKALGGDVSTPYPDADAVWNEINGIYETTGRGIDIEELIVDITENGTYNYETGDTVDAYAPVKISVNVEGGGSGDSGLHFDDEADVQLAESILHVKDLLGYD